MQNYKLGAFVNQIKRAFRSSGLPFENDAMLNGYDIAVQTVLRDMRHTWRRGSGIGRGTSAEKLNRRRFAQNKYKAALNRFRSRPRAKLPKPLLAHRYKNSSILSGFVNERTSKWKPLLRRTDNNVSIEINLKDFSFIDNPNGTLSALKEIAEAECRCLNSYVHFQDKFCTDVAPYLVLAEMWPSMAHVFRGGKMNVPVQKKIDAVGLRKSLGMALRGVDNHEDLWAFPIQRRRPAGSSKSRDRFLEPQSHEKVTDRFCDAIDDWLGLPEIDQTLTVTGRGWIGGIINEMLDNAERHSYPNSKDGDWSVAGFMARRMEDEEAVYRCYLAFMSVGATISESLRTCLPMIEAQMQEYCGRHIRSGGSGPSADTLRTLYALQDTVTCDPEADRGGRGGFGFQEMMRFVNELGGTAKLGKEPRITIISGSSCIQLRPPYILGTRTTDGSSPRVLWCNPENSPTLPPDPAFVFDLTERLAGTIISVTFTLDPDYLNETV